MEKLKIITICIISLVYLISPIDLLPGCAVDDVLVLIGAILRVNSLRKQIAD